MPPSSSANDLFEDFEIDDDADIAALEAAEHGGSAVAGPSNWHQRKRTETDEVEDFSDHDMHDIIEILDDDDEEQGTGARAAGLKKPGDLRGAGKIQHAPSSASSKSKQRDLYGNIVSSDPAASRSGSSSKFAGPAARRPSRKVWDEEENNRLREQRRRRKAGRADDDSDLEGDIYGEVEGKHTKMDHSNVQVPVDEEAAKTWIYPTNMPKRDYQFNIVQKALLDNVLVALPTGLGKTFIAAVVILNYYYWFPTGKIIFVAPTRPLVAQQQKACHGICGLPWDTAIELTGSTKQSLRGDEWETKRIFYMTPQTLENDLLSTNCDASQIVCLVVDEAHHATGNFAYCNVVRYLMKHNPNFRILALTATPGSTSERVQEVVDSLHIGDVQMRSEDSIDIKKYVHQKKEHFVTANFNDDMRKLVDVWKKLMQRYLDPLVKDGILYQANPMKIHPFAAQSKSKEIARDQSKRRHIGNLNILADLARTRVKLIEYSIEMFCDSCGLKKAPAKGKAKGSDSPKEQALAQIAPILARMRRESPTNNAGIPHPKMRKLLETIENHFIDHTTEETMKDQVHLQSTQGRAGVPRSSMRQTRAIVFCSLRECVNEIVSYLNEEGFPYGVKATHFVGQAKGASGKGMTQKIQNEVVAKFKSGAFNVIVATSIGEEGLDIGDVDLIVNYDTVKDSVRSLQRVGRTGRKRDGKIVILCAENGAEEDGWKKSKEKYKDVQRQIHSGYGHGIELYTDIPRMLPDHIKPSVVLKDVEQPAFFEPDMISGRKGSGGKQGEAKPKVKRKTLKEAIKNPPKGSVLGFVTANKYAKAQAGSDDDDDDDECDVVRRPKTKPRVSAAKAKAKAKAAARIKVFSDETDDSDSEDARPARSRPEPSKAAESKSRPAFAILEADDDDDMSDELEDLQTILAKGKKAVHSSITSAKQILKIPPRSATSSQDLGAKGSSDTPIVLSDDDEVVTAAAGPARPIAKASTLPPPGPLPAPSAAEPSSEFDVTWECNSDELEAVMLAAEAQRNAASPASPATHADHPIREASSPIRRPASVRDDEASPVATFKRKAAPSIALLMAEVEAAEAAAKKVPKKRGPASSAKGAKTASAAAKSKGAARRADAESSNDSDIFDDIDDDILFDIPSGVARGGGPPKGAAREVPRPTATTQKLSVTAQAAVSAAPVDTQADLESSESRILVRRPRARVAFGADADSSPIVAPLRARIVPGSPPPTALGSSPTELMGAPALPTRGLKRKAPAPPTAATPLKKMNGREARGQSKAGKVKKKRIGHSPTSRMLFADQAERSTDEERHGERDEDDEGLSTDEEDEEDRRAVGHFLPTQAPKGYDQQSVYAQSLNTQIAPTPFRREQRGGFFGGRYGIQETPVRMGAGASSARQRVPSTGRSSRYGPNGTPDRYSEDSFCAGDDEEIEYETGTGEEGSSQM